MMIMKIGLNTYSFRRELESKSLTHEQIWKILDKIGLFDGIELLDKHVPGWPHNLQEGVKIVKEQMAVYNWKLYALGPHVKMYQGNKSRDKEIEEYKKWIDLASDNDIPQIRSQVGGTLNFFSKINPSGGIKKVSQLLDKVLPYAEQRNVKIGIETHWAYSSEPRFLEQITELFKSKYGNSLGIIFDWGNFFTNKARYEALDIASKPNNHCHNHVKMFDFGENFQQIYNPSVESERFNYDSIRIVKKFAENGFKNYFSIEFEGKQPTIEGVYKSAHALKYAITNGNHKINPNFNWNSLL
jgi:sugar phosphate isomerase/epimerase